MGALFLAPAGGTGFISPDLAVNGVVKSGYVITRAATTAPAAAIVALAAATCNASVANAMSGYFATATPVSFGTSGTRLFATDTRGTVFQNTANVALAEPLATAGTVVPVQ